MTRMQPPKTYGPAPLLTPRLPIPAPVPQADAPRAGAESSSSVPLAMLKALPRSMQEKLALYQSDQKALQALHQTAKESEQVRE